MFCRSTLQYLCAELPKTRPCVCCGQWGFRSLRVRQRWSVERTNVEHQKAHFPFDYLVFMTAGCPRRGSNWNASNCPARQRPQLLISTQGSESVGISSNRLPNPIAATAHSTLASHNLLSVYILGPNMIGFSQSGPLVLLRGSGSRPLWNWSGIRAISSSLCVPVRIEAADVTNNFCTEGDLISRARRRKTLS